MEEDPRFLTEQIVTYLGNKRSLLHFLGTGLEQVKKRLGKERLKAGDLFSGSGAIGIEALSRGAGLAVMIENNPKALECIRENLSRTKLEDRAMVMGCDVITGLKRLEGKNYKFDIVFMDPPYNHEYERLVLDYLNHSPMVTEETLIVIEASRETEFGWLEESGWHMIKSKEYKTNKHVFVGRGE